MTRALSSKAATFVMTVGAWLVPWMAEIAADEPSDVTPILSDDRLQLTLFADSPRIVTPIGLAVGQHDGVFVIESHTHIPPSDYDGPKSDRVKILRDLNGDGRCDEAALFAEGLAAAMNLAFSSTGVLYVVCAREVVALHDDNGDGVCDRRQRVIELVTDERYPHNCLLGLTFSPDNWMYVARGNVGSRKYTVKGSDGSQVAGYGDGGSIFRCRPDGSQVEQFATGFWNPFDIKFDRATRLLCVDNDPDARGPNRLLHVAQGGDYGYKSLYGGGGNHPFQAWDGELPGTLPMIGGTGEAPCGVFECQRAALPEDYRDSLLVSVWNENTIERHKLRSHGMSLVAERSTLVRGGKDFRPVALDSDSQGNIYISDWVLVDYPNHGRGRIWRLSTRPGTATMTPQPYHGPEPVEASPLLQADLDGIIGKLQSDDPFVRHAAVRALADWEPREQIARLLRHDSAAVRLGFILASKSSSLPPSKEAVRVLLADTDEEVRIATLLWCAESLDASLRPDLNRAIEGPSVSARLFEVYLAAVTQLQQGFITTYRHQRGDKSRDIPRPLEHLLLQTIILNARLPSNVQALAVARLDPAEAARQRSLLNRLARESSGDLQLAAIRKLGEQDDQASRAVLMALATDGIVSSDIRIESLWALDSLDVATTEPLLALLADVDPRMQLAAARFLTASRDNSAVKAALAERQQSTAAGSSKEAFEDQLRFALQPNSDPLRPDSLEAWQQRLASGGDPLAGRHVFYSARATCTKCHTVGGRGGALGPDLSHVSQSSTRQQIVQSILRPSETFAPQYQAWQVLTSDGRTHVGLQLDHKSGGAIELLSTDGQVVHFKADEIDDYLASPRSVMPDGLEANLSIHELRDLVAFLDSLGP